MMIVNLTPAGEQAIWAWVCTMAKNAQEINRQSWLAEARTQVNITGKDDSGKYRIWLRGAQSESGFLHALVLKPDWFRVQAKRATGAANSTQLNAMTFF